MEEENRNNRCRLPCDGSAPWLVYTHGNDRRRKFQTFCTLSSSQTPPFTKHYSKSIPQLRGKSILSSNDGWLILRDLTNLNMFTLWNPTSSLQTTIHLPPLNLLEDQPPISWAIVCPPPPPEVDDVSVFIFVNGTAFSCRPHNNNNNNNNNTWIAHNTHLLGQRAEVQDAIICNGVIYGYVCAPLEGVRVKYYYVIIEVDNNNGYDFDGMLTLRLLGVEVPEHGFLYTSSRQHLLASCGRVYVVGIHSRAPTDKRICAVDIWELDLDSMKWLRVKCLEDRAFLLGAKSSTWCWGRSIDNNELGGVKRNSVYFEVCRTDLWGVPKAMYLYNLEDESLTSFLPCPSIPSFSDDPSWITTPQYQRLGKDDKYKHCTGKVDLLKQGLHDQNEERTLLHKSASSQTSDALSLTFDKQKQNDEFLLSELSFDLIALVATYMHLFDFMKFRTTCKEFRCLTPMAGWRVNNTPYPLLMFFESEEPRCTLIDPCRNGSCYIVLPEIFQGAVHIDSSKDGWLLLRTNGGVSLHLFNPFTGVTSELPPCRFIRSVTSVGFSTCPISSDCVTVGINWFSKEYALICYHRFKEETWHECMLGHDFGVEFWSVSRSPIYHKGAFYFWDIRGYLGVFQLVNEQGTRSWDVYGKPQTPNGDTNTLPSSYLVECGGELLSVFIGDMGKWVRVFRFDPRKKKWTRVTSLGNHLLFVGTSSSFSAVAKEREMENRIYLPRTRGNDILFYALDTGKYTTHMGDESFEDFSGTKELLRCTWI